MQGFPKAALPSAWAELKAIEISAPAMIMLCPSGDSSPRLTPSPARMKENSPICARLAEIVSAVCTE